MGMTTCEWDGTGVKNLLPPTDLCTVPRWSREASNRATIAALRRLSYCVSKVGAVKI